MASDIYPLNSIAATDSALVIGDSSNNLWRMVPNGANGQMAITKNGVLTGLGQYPVTAKAASYTLLASDSGGTFTTTGATGAVTFTLPAVATSKGFRYQFVNTVGQNMVVTAPAGTLVTFNNAAATSATFSTAGNLIGAGLEVLCDGAKWLAFPTGANTLTVS